MLSDEVYDKLIKRLTDRIDNVNTYILDQIGEKINEIGKLKPTQANQLVNIMKYGGDYKKIVKELSKITKLNMKEIDQIFNEVAKSDYRFAKQFYEYRNKPYVPFDENRALVNEIEAVKRATLDTYRNLSNTKMLGYVIKNKKGKLVFKTIKQVYNDIIDEGVLSITQGKDTLSNVLKSTIESIGESGLRIKYPSGYTRRLDSSIKMNLNDGINQLHNRTQDILGEQFDADGVEISAHINPAKDHEWLQGRQFSLKEYDKLNNGKEAVAYDGTIIHKNDKRRPVSTMNCRHYVYKIVLGVSKTNYSDEELLKILSDNEDGFNLNNRHYTNYEGTQMQRQLELKIRQELDKIELAKKSNDPKLEEITLKSNKKIKVYRKKKRELQKLIFGG